MNRIIRAVVATGLALAVSLLVSAAQAAPAERAAAKVAFKEIEKECSTSSVDGQEQTQCRASFTVAASRVKPGYKIKVIQAKTGSLMKRTVGKFTATKSKASERFENEVCSFGATDSPTKVKFYALVKDADGKKVVKTKPQTLC